MNTAACRSALFCLFVVAFVSSCTGPRVRLTEIAQASAPPADCQPYLISVDGQVPAEARLLGETRYGDTGFSVDCTGQLVRELPANKIK